MLYWLLLISVASTALFAASIAITQRDIKKVLAYSTVSQFGYMFLAVGTGAYTAAFFHLLTHAMFEANLYLWFRVSDPFHASRFAHKKHDLMILDPQDMFDMGGFRKKYADNSLVNVAKHS